MSKGIAVGLSGRCLMEILPGWPCLRSWDMAKELRGAHLHLLGTGRQRMGNDGTTWKSFCRPPHSREAVPQVTSPKKQPLYAVVLASRHQMSSWLWRKTAGISPGASRDRSSTSWRRPRECMVAGGNWMSLRRSQGSSEPPKSQQALQQGR